MNKNTKLFLVKPKTHEKSCNKKIFVYTSSSVEGGNEWKEYIENLIKLERKSIRLTDKSPDMVIVLGGDGTILRAIEKYKNENCIFMGLNMGKLGFLASTRHKGSFKEKVVKVLDGDYSIQKRVALYAKVKRDDKIAERFFAMNEARIESLLGNVFLDIEINGYLMQKIYGNGALISTPTGSTAFNLSIDGPVIRPEVKVIIVSEVMDHNLPTPKLIVNDTDKIVLSVTSFREKGLVKSEDNRESMDVVLRCDSRKIFNLQVGDKIEVERFRNLIDFVDLGDNYFLQSLQKHFGFS